MVRLQHVASAPRGAASESPATAAAFVDAYRFAAADDYLFSVPMWNTGVPYLLGAGF